MKFYSKIFKAKVITSIFIVIWLIILVFITINHTLSCVKTNGCLKKSCKKKSSNGTTIPLSQYSHLIYKLCPDNNTLFEI